MDHNQPALGSISPSAIASAFPQELIDQIIDHFDFKTLKTHAVVSPPWLASTRRHLFRTIRVHTYSNAISMIPNSRDLTALATLLDGNPSFSSWIWHVQISGITHFPALLSVVTNLTQLRSLILAGAGICSIPQPLPPPPYLLRSIEKLSFSYTTVDYHGPSYIPKLFLVQMFTSVSELRIEADSSFGDDFKGSAASETPRLIPDTFSSTPITTSLQLVEDVEVPRDFKKPFVRQLLQSLNFRSLTTLSISAWPSASCAEYTPLLYSSASSLKTLFIMMRGAAFRSGLDQAIGTWRQLDISSCKSLRTISFDFHTYDRNTDMWQLVLDILSTLSSPPSVHAIIFHASFSQNIGGYPAARAVNLARTADVLVRLGALREFVMDLDSWAAAVRGGLTMPNLRAQLKRLPKSCKVILQENGKALADDYNAEFPIPVENGDFDEPN